MRRRCHHLNELCTVYIYQRAYNFLLENCGGEGEADLDRLAVCVTKLILGSEPTDTDGRVFFRNNKKRVAELADRAVKEDTEIRDYAGFTLRVMGVLAGPPEGNAMIDRAAEIDPDGRVPDGKRIQAILRAKNLRYITDKIEAEKAGR